MSRTLVDGLGRRWHEIHLCHAGSRFCWKSLPLFSFYQTCPNLTTWGILKSPNRCPVGSWIRCQRFGEPERLQFGTSLRLHLCRQRLPCFWIVLCQSVCHFAEFLDIYGHLVSHLVISRCAWCVLLSPHSRGKKPCRNNLIGVFQYFPSWGCVKNGSPMSAHL